MCKVTHFEKFRGEKMKNVVFANIESERMKNGLSKKQLSTDIGIGERHYYNYIHGITPIPSHVLIKLSKRLNKSIDYLLS